MKHIEEAFESYLKDVVKHPVGPDLKVSMRKMFFAGAMSVVSALFLRADMDTLHSTAEEEQVIVDVLQEMHEFKLEIDGGIATLAGLPNRVIVSLVESTDGWTHARLACGHEFSFMTAVGVGSPAPCAQCISDYIAKSKRASL